MSLPWNKVSGYGTPRRLRVTSQLEPSSTQSAICVSRTRNHCTQPEILQSRLSSGEPEAEGVPRLIAGCRWIIRCLASRVEGRGSRVEGRGSRVE
eukprot:3705508-Rhodomonas_salina.1